MTRWNWKFGNVRVKGQLRVEEGVEILGDLDFGDATTDTLTCTGALTCTSDVTFTLGSGEAFTINCTDLSAPLVMTNTITTGATTGGRALFVLNVQAAMGGWSNAIKGEATYNASGSTTGLGTVVCGDLTLSTGTTSGTYAVFEGNIIAESSASTGTATACMHFNADGADEATIDANAFLIAFGDALVAGAANFIDTNITTHTKYAAMRIWIPGTGVKYIPVVSD